MAQENIFKRLANLFSGNNKVLETPSLNVEQEDIKANIEETVEKPKLSLEEFKNSDEVINFKYAINDLINSSSDRETLFEDAKQMLGIVRQLYRGTSKEINETIDEYENFLKGEAKRNELDIMIDNLAMKDVKDITTNERAAFSKAFDEYEKYYMEYIETFDRPTNPNETLPETIDYYAQALIDFGCEANTEYKIYYAAREKTHEFPKNPDNGQEDLLKNEKIDGTIEMIYNNKRQFKTNCLFCV